jgi:hypothetical protein
MGASAWTANRDPSAEKVTAGAFEGLALCGLREEMFLLLIRGVAFSQSCLRRHGSTHNLFQTIGELTSFEVGLIQR